MKSKQQTHNSTLSRLDFRVMVHRLKTFLPDSESDLTQSHNHHIAKNTLILFLAHTIRAHIDSLTKTFLYCEQKRIAHCV